MRELAMTKPFLPPVSASAWGTPEAVLSVPFEDLAGPEQKTAILMAVECGCLARLVRKRGLTRREIEKALAAAPALPAVFSNETELASAKRTATYEARRDARWQESIRAVCVAVNDARRAGGHAVGEAFVLTTADLVEALGLKANTARGNLRVAASAGFLQLLPQTTGGHRPVSIPQSTIDEMGLEP